VVSGTVGLCSRAPLFTISLLLTVGPSTRRPHAFEQAVRFSLLLYARDAAQGEGQAAGGGGGPSSAVQRILSALSAATTASGWGPPVRARSALADLDPDVVYNCHAEMEAWAEVKTEDMDVDPIVFWNRTGVAERFPILQVLANSFLCIPATSVPCESLFSIARKSPAYFGAVHVEGNLAYCAVTAVVG
jgi:hypothetical protein